MKLGLPLALISLAALSGALFFTNPNEEDYAAFLSEQVSLKVQEEICAPEGFSNWLGKVGDVLSGACQDLLASGEELSADEVQTVIKDRTDYKNRILFSTYTTEMPFGTYKGFAIFNQFILKPADSDSPPIDQAG